MSEAAGSASSDQPAFGPQDVAAVVLGVHRSGTSLLTAGLAALGCTLGELADDAGESNPKGHFENPAVRAFNDRLLARLGAGWDNWGFDATAVDFEGPDFAEERAEAARLIVAAFAGRSPFAVKDPRMALVLPFWEAVFARTGIRPRRILIVRDPAEVAASQAARAASNASFHRLLTAPAPMHALWCVTMDTILRTLPDDDTLLVAHADLYDRPRQLLETVAAFLGVRADADRLDAFADGFVEPGLRRAGAGQGDADMPLARVSRGLFEALSADGVPRRLPRWQARRIAEGPAGIAALRPLLPAVFASLSDASTVAARERERIRRLRRAANLLGDLATRQAPEAVLGDRREEIDALAEGAGEDTDILCFRAAQIAERLGDLAAADRLFARAAEAAPHFAAAAAGRMRVLRRAGRAREAEAVRLAAAEAFPDNPAFRPG